MPATDRSVRQIKMILSSLLNILQGSTYTKILHNEHGLKWVITNSLDILKRSEDV
jgi:hypothetical protein